LHVAPPPDGLDAAAVATGALMQVRCLEVPAGWSVDETPQTLASLRVTGGSGFGWTSDQDDIAWCRSLVEQLDSAASACVVEVLNLWIYGAEDLAWLQSPRVRLDSHSGDQATPQKVQSWPPRRRRFPGAA